MKKIWRKKTRKRIVRVSIHDSPRDYYWLHDLRVASVISVWVFVIDIDVSANHANRENIFLCTTRRSRGCHWSRASFISAPSRFSTFHIDISPCRLSPTVRDAYLPVTVWLWARGKVLLPEFNVGVNGRFDEKPPEPPKGLGPIRLLLVGGACEFTNSYLYHVSSSRYSRGNTLWLHAKREVQSEKRENCCKRTLYEDENKAASDDSKLLRHYNTNFIPIWQTRCHVTLSLNNFPMIILFHRDASVMITSQKCDKLISDLYCSKSQGTLALHLKVLFSS